MVVKQCYEKAGVSIPYSDACDLFETDMIKILWDQLDLYEMLVFNRDKYIFTYVKMPIETFDEMIKEIKEIAKDLSDMLDEVEAYKQLIVVRIKSFVDDKTHGIVELASSNKSKGIKKFKDYDIKIRQTVHDNSLDLSQMNLPRPILKDASTHNVFVGESPYPDLVQQIDHMKSENLQKVYGGAPQVTLDSGDKSDQRFAINQVLNGINSSNRKLRGRNVNQVSLLYQVIPKII